jgi:gas vesicle protein
MGEVRMKARSRIDARNIVIGVLIGGLVGAATMLLLAPKSGRQTRFDIQQKSIQLRDRTTDIGKKALAQARLDARGITAGVREKAGQLKQIGQDQLVRQMDRLSAVIDPGNQAAKIA